MVKMMSTQQERYTENRKNRHVLPLMTPAPASATRAAGFLTAGRPRASTWAGWINVVVAAVIMLATLPGRTQGLGLITEPMLRDLQLDRVTYANINLWATLLGAAICLPIGRLFDRVGLRGTTVALTLLLGVVVWTMSGLAGGALDAVPAGARHAGARTERAVGRQHHRRRQVVRPPRRRGDGRLLGAAERVLRGGVHRGRDLGPRQRLAHGLGQVAVSACSCSRRRSRCCCASGPRRSAEQDDCRRSAACRCREAPAHAGVLGLRRRDVAVRPGVVRARALQRSRARRTRLRPADLRQVPGGDVDHRPRRAD